MDEDGTCRKYGSSNIKFKLFLRNTTRDWAKKNIYLIEPTKYLFQT